MTNYPSIYCSLSLVDGISKKTGKPYCGVLITSSNFSFISFDSKLISLVTRDSLKAVLPSDSSDDDA